MKKISGKCADIRDKLIYAEMDDLDERDRRLVSTHLESCEECRQYQQYLINMLAAMNLAPAEQLEPDPRIRARLLRKLNPPIQRRARKRITDWKDLFKILEYRIPVYQAILTFGIILVLFIGFFPHSPATVEKPPDRISHMEDDSLALNQPDVYRNLQSSDNSRYGRNLQEDSILARYMSSAL
jgi:anti-sigma factor RsiW